MHRLLGRREYESLAIIGSPDRLLLVGMLSVVGCGRHPGEERAQDSDPYDTDVADSDPQDSDVEDCVPTGTIDDCRAEIDADCDGRVVCEEEGRDAQWMVGLEYEEMHAVGDLDDDSRADLVSGGSALFVVLGADIAAPNSPYPDVPNYVVDHSYVSLPEDWSGLQVDPRSAGDLDADGRGDVIAAVFEEYYLTADSLGWVPGRVLAQEGTHPWDESVHELAPTCGLTMAHGVGDVTGDDRDDLLVSCYLWGGLLIDGAALTSGATFSDSTWGMLEGGSIDVVRVDFDGDGAVDAVAGDPLQDDREGGAYLVLADDLALGGDLSAADAAQTWVGRGAMGDVLVSPGDLDQDGIDDVVIGSDRGLGGEVLLYAGSREPRGTKTDDDALTRIEGARSGDRLGWDGSTSAAGDVDQDSVPDLAVLSAAGWFEPDGAGLWRLCLFSGQDLGAGGAYASDACRAAYESTAVGSTLGQGVIADHDVTGDSFNDVIVYAANASVWYGWPRDL